MEQYQNFISQSSIWISSIPTAVSASFPFYSTEAGHFSTKNGYSVSRSFHDSFLLLYTISGTGAVKTMGETFLLLPGQAVLMDCHIPHHYRNDSPFWEFLWVHIQGNGIAPLFPILYPSNIHAISLLRPDAFCQSLLSLLNLIQKNDIRGAENASRTIHALFGDLLASSMEGDRYYQNQKYSPDIHKVIQLIHSHYSQPLSVDRMIQDIPLSKYHFIRMFRRIMGVTPYQYLMNYRINQSKHLLRLSDSSISEIAVSCGFSDASNFISQFKKHVGQTPSQYQRDFRCAFSSDPSSPSAH